MCVLRRWGVFLYTFAMFGYSAFFVRSACCVLPIELVTRRARCAGSIRAERLGQLRHAPQLSLRSVSDSINPTSERVRSIILFAAHTDYFYQGVLTGGVGALMESTTSFDRALYDVVRSFRLQYPWLLTSALLQ